MTPKRRYEAPLPPPPRDGTVEGVITIVQEDRFRLMDDHGRGYLFTTRKRAASMDELERWRDQSRRLVVRFSGIPDIGARAVEIAPADGCDPRGASLPYRALHFFDRRPF